MLKELEPITNKLNEERGILNRALDKMTEAEAAQVMVTPEWTIKDELAHLAGAERGMTRIARGMGKGENPHLPEGYNNDEYNARQVAKRKDKSLAELREELNTTRAELVALLESVTPEQLALRGEHPLYGDIALKDLLVVIYSHESTHSNEIAAKYRESKK
ncbi:MAG: DinB family protein [Chloroflexi bacterium]|nr:DinB family protein [Chloroflexota bacterium]